MTVRFTCVLGEGTASWRGAVRPAPGEDHDVELDIVHEPTWGETLHLSTGGGSLPSVLAGVIEAYDETSMVIRVGGSPVAMLPKGESPVGADVGAAVIIERLEIALWPYDV